jgi:hypothetical protein
LMLWPPLIFHGLWDLRRQVILFLILGNESRFTDVRSE